MTADAGDGRAGEARAPAAAAAPRPTTPPPPAADDAAATPTKGARPVRVRAICQAGDISSTVSPDETVAALRDRLFEAWPPGLAGCAPTTPAALLLIAAGRRLTPDERFIDAAVPRLAPQPEVVSVHVVVRRPEDRSGKKPGAGGGGGSGGGGPCCGCALQ